MLVRTQLSLATFKKEVNKSYSNLFYCFDAVIASFPSSLYALILLELSLWKTISEHFWVELSRRSSFLLVDSTKEWKHFKDTRTLRSPSFKNRAIWYSVFIWDAGFCLLHRKRRIQLEGTKQTLRWCLSPLSTVTLCPYYRTTDHVLALTFLQELCELGQANRFLLLSSMRRLS